MIFRRAFNIPVPGLIFSILGLLYCIFMSVGVGTEVVCLTSGCALVDDFRLFGLSPWWVAAFFFGLMTALSIFRLRALAHVFATLMLLGDLLFMLLMVFLAPCTSCLIAAILIFSAWVSLRSRPAMLVTPRRILAGGIGAVWGLLFLLNLGPVLHELPAPMVVRADTVSDAASSAGPKVSIYFSPSCPACLEAARVFGGSAVYYPVAENEGDIGMLADIQARMGAGQSFLGALEEVHKLGAADGYASPETGLWQNMTLRIALMRNQAKLTAQDFQALPVIMFEGMPRSWVSGAATAQPVQQSAAQSEAVSDVPAESGAAGAVSGESAAGDSGVALPEAFTPGVMQNGLDTLQKTLGDIIESRSGAAAAADNGESGLPTEAAGEEATDGQTADSQAVGSQTANGQEADGQAAGNGNLPGSGLPEKKTDADGVVQEPAYVPAGAAGGGEDKADGAGSVHTEPTAGSTAASVAEPVAEPFADPASPASTVSPASPVSPDAATSGTEPDGVSAPAPAEPVTANPDRESEEPFAASVSGNGGVSGDTADAGGQAGSAAETGSADPAGTRNLNGTENPAASGASDVTNRTEALSGADLPPDLLEGTIECGHNSPQPCD